MTTESARLNEQEDARRDERHRRLRAERDELRRLLDAHHYGGKGTGITCKVCGEIQ